MGATSSRPTHTADHFLYQAAQFVDDIANTIQRLISNLFSLIFTPFSTSSSPRNSAPKCDETGLVCVRPPTVARVQERDRKRKAMIRMKRAEAAAQGLDPRLVVNVGLGLKRTSTNATATSTSSRPIGAAIKDRGLKDGLKEKVEEEKDKLMGKIQDGKQRMVEKLEVEKGKMMNRVEEEKVKGGNRWKALLNDLHSVEDLTGGGKRSQGDGITSAKKEKPLWVMGNVRPMVNEQSAAASSENITKHFNQIPISIAALATANVGLASPKKSDSTNQEKQQLDLKPSELAGNPLVPKPTAPARKSSKKVKKDNPNIDDHRDSPADDLLAARSKPEQLRAVEPEAKKVEGANAQTAEKEKHSERSTTEVKVTEPSRFFSPPGNKPDTRPSTADSDAKDAPHQVSTSKQDLQSKEVQASPTSIAGTASHHTRKASGQDLVTFQVIASSSSSGASALHENVENRKGLGSDLGKPKSKGLPDEVIPRTRKSSRTRKTSMIQVAEIVEGLKEQEKKSEEKSTNVEVKHKPDKSEGVDEPLKPAQTLTIQKPTPIRASNGASVPPIQTTNLISPIAKRAQRIQLPNELFERGSAPSPANFNSARNSLDVHRVGAITPPLRVNGTASPSSASVRSSTPSPMVLNLLNKAKEAFNEIVNSDAISADRSSNNGTPIPNRAWSPALSATTNSSSNSSNNINRPRSPITPNFEKVSCLADKACMKKWESSSKERKKWKDEVNKMALYRVQQGQSGIGLNSASNNLNGLNYNLSSNTVSVATGFTSGAAAVGAHGGASKRRASAGGAALGRSNSTNSTRRGTHRRSGSTDTGTTHINLKDSSVTRCNPPPSAPSQKTRERSNKDGLNGSPIGIGKIPEGATINSHSTNLTYDQAGLQRRTSGKAHKKSPLS